MEKEADLRDWFAGQAMVGIYASLSTDAAWPDEKLAREIADVAYRQADAMMAAREATKDRPHGA